MSVRGVRASGRQEAVWSRLHLRWLSSPSLPLDKLEMCLEAVSTLAGTPPIAAAIFAAFDCSVARIDLLAEVHVMRCIGLEST